MNIFTMEHYDDKTNAIQLLNGLTHYYDKDTMKFHGSSLVFATISDKGLLLATVEKYTVDYQGTKKAFRPVIFDIFGSIVNDKPNLENGLNTKEKAIKLMWDQLNNLNAKKITRDGIKNKQENLKRGIKNLRNQLKEL